MSRPFASWETEMETLAEEEGMEMILLSLAEVPPARSQSDLTPLQREVLLRAYLRLKQKESEALRGIGGR